MSMESSSSPEGAISVLEKMLYKKFIENKKIWVKSSVREKIQMKLF